MSRLMPSILRKTLVAGALVAAALLSLPQASTADYDGLCDYFSDATHTQQVGARGYDCCGHWVSWGEVTEHSECYVINCEWCPDVS